MYIDSGKDLKINKITSPRPDRIEAGGNSITQVPVKQSTLIQQQSKSMKTTGSVTPSGEKYA